MIFLTVDTVVSTSFTTMSNKWSAKMVFSQVLAPKFRNPDNLCYSKESKLTPRLSIAFIFKHLLSQGKKNGDCLEFKSSTETLKCSTSNTLCSQSYKGNMGILTQLWTDSGSTLAFQKPNGEKQSRENLLIFWKSTTREGVTTQEKTIEKCL